MTSVFIAEKSPGKEFFRSVGYPLRQHFSTIMVSRRKITIPEQDASLLVSDVTSFDAAQSKHSVILFKDVQKIAFEFSPGDGTIAVVDSCNAKLIKYVSETKLPAITCGLSPKDTLTLSSIDVDSAVINLQRGINCFDGSEAEPQEIPVHLARPMDSFALMSVAAVFIVCGQIERLSDILL